MRASELIEELSKAIKESGDLEVFFTNACFKYGLSKEQVNVVKSKMPDRWKKQPYLELDNR